MGRFQSGLPEEIHHLYFDFRVVNLKKMKDLLIFPLLNLLDQR